MVRSRLDLSDPIRMAWAMMLAVLVAITFVGAAKADALQESRTVLEGLALTTINAADKNAVSIPQQIATPLKNLDPLYHGFSISGLSVEDHGGTGKGADSKWFSGTMVLENPLRRRVLLSVNADYNATNGKLAVTSAQVGMVSPPFPKIDIFFVPAARNQAVANAPSFYDMMVKLVENAMPPDQIDAFGGSYFIYAAARERLDHQASLWVRVGDTPDGIGKADGTTRNFDFEGWRIAANSAPMAINAGTTRYIKVFLRLGDVAYGQPQATRLVHLTTNKIDDLAAITMPKIKTNAAMGKASPLRAAPQATAPVLANLAAGSAVGVVDFSRDGQWAYVIDAAHQMGYVSAHELTAGTGVVSAPQAKAPTPTTTPTAKTATGMMYLNKPTDAAALQQRLADLGFFNGAVDGKWGPASRQALRAFKASNGLEDSPVWDRQTQDYLFPR